MQVLQADVAAAIEQQRTLIEGGELRKGEHLHPYLDIFFRCQAFGNGINGAPCLPQAGGVLDQDAELMFYFDKFLEVSREHEQAKEATKKQFDTQIPLTPTTIIND